MTIISGSGLDLRQRQAQLEAHAVFIRQTRALYGESVIWVAPRRNLVIAGRDNLICHLLREAAGMRNPDFTYLRRSESARQIIDEYVVRFTYTGEGIDGAGLRAGNAVELERVRIIEMLGGQAVKETSIETWMVRKT